MTGLDEPADLAGAISRLAREAGAVILEVYAGDFEARIKTDSSPVTEADERAEAVILSGLDALTPDIPVVAEESAAAGRIPEIGTGPFWLVDPLDGTKEFLKRNGEFTVNIALIRDGIPILGVVYLPAMDTLYAGIAAGPGAPAAWREDAGGRTALSVRPPPEAGLTVIGSRSHGDSDAMAAFLQGRAVAETVSAGSSLKFCRVAEGAADLYPRLGRTMEWDVAAGHAVLAGAGGTVTRTDGSPFPYGKAPVFENPHFAAWGGLRP
jgi:3'(2'), 5'-bisphosphate nucleotidase